MQSCSASDICVSQTCTEVHKTVPPPSQMASTTTKARRTIIGLHHQGPADDTAEINCYRYIAVEARLCHGKYTSALFSIKHCTEHDEDATVEI
jgi:hypothetical protein